MVEQAMASIDAAGGDDKVLFEIFREAAAERRYCVIYYTALDSRKRDAEIDHAMEGEPVYAGYLDGGSLARALGEIGTILERLNRGEQLGEAEFDRLLADHLVT